MKADVHHFTDWKLFCATFREEEPLDAGEQHARRGPVGQFPAA